VHVVEVVPDADLRKKEAKVKAVVKRFFPNAGPVRLYRTAEGRVGCQLDLTVAGDRKRLDQAYHAIMDAVGERRGPPRTVGLVHADSDEESSHDVFPSLNESRIGSSRPGGNLTTRRAGDALSLPSYRCVGRGHGRAAATGPRAYGRQDCVENLQSVMLRAPFADEFLEQFAVFRLQLVRGEQSIGRDPGGWAALTNVPGAHGGRSSGARCGCVIRARLLARSETTLPRRRRPRWLARRAHQPVRDVRR